MRGENMNRAERRRLNKEDASVLKGIDYATKALFASFAMVLHDKWGWGHVRIRRLLEQVDDMFESIDKEYVTIEDLKQTILDETGIKLE